MIAGDLAARRTAVALMLGGIALDAIVAPAQGAASAAVRASFPDAAATLGVVAPLALAAYVVAVVASLWSARMFGKRNYLAVSFFGFAVAAVTAAAAPDAAIFAGARIVEWLALGGVFANALLTLTATSPKRDLGTVFAIFAVLALALPTLAPLIAGGIVAAGSWRVMESIFAIVAAIIGAGALAVLRDPAAAPGAVRFLDGGVLARPVVARGIAVAALLGVLLAGGEVQLEYAREFIHLPALHASSVLALRVAGILAGALAVTFAGERVDGRTWLLGGFAVLVAAFVAQGAVTAAALGEGALALVMLLHGVGVALVMGPLGSLLFGSVDAAHMPSLVVFFKLAVLAGTQLAPPLVARLLALEDANGRPAAWAFADVWAAGAAVAVVAAVVARGLRVRATPVAVAAALLLALCALPAVVRAQTAPPRPIYLPLRDEEDWRSMRDPKLRIDALDGLKAVPLGKDPSQYLTLSGEVRQWFEHYVDADWQPGNGSNAYALPRYLLGADVHSFRFHTFVQFESAAADGRRGPPNPIYRNDLDVTDAYLGWRFGPRDDAPSRVGLLLGRQEFDYGSGRVISARDGAGIRSSFDGIRAVLRTSAWRYDVFVAQPVKIGRFAFDDTPDTTQTLAGVYAQRTLPVGRALEWYALSDWRAAAAYLRGTAPETRYTLGARAQQRFGRLTAEVEASRQFGTFGRSGRSVAIAAASAATSLSYTLGGRGVIPAFGVSAGYGGGDDTPRGTLHAYVPPSFRGSYLGAVQENGPQNSFGFEPSVTLSARDTSLSFAEVVMRAATTSDALASLAGFPLRRPGPNATLDAGAGPLVTLTQRAGRHLQFTAIYQRLSAGGFFSGTPAAPITYERLVSDFRF